MPSLTMEEMLKLQEEESRQKQTTTQAPASLTMEEMQAAQSEQQPTPSAALKSSTNEGPKKQWLEDRPWMKAYASGIKGNVERTKGFLKEAVTVPLRAAELGAGIGRSASNALNKARGLEPAPKSELIENAIDRPDILTPQNKEQEQGAFVENIAEFMVPNPYSVAKIPAAANKAVKLAKKAPFIERALNVGEKVLSSGLEQGARGSIQAGSSENLETDFALGASVPLAGKALKVGGSVATNVAKTISSKLSGVPSTAIEEAFRNPTAVQGAIRKMSVDPDLGPKKIMEVAEQSFDDLLKNRSQNYRQGLEKIEKETMQTKAGQWYVKKFDNELQKELFVPVDFTLKGVKDVATRTLKEFGAEAKGKIINLDDVPLPNSHKNDLREVVDKIYGWQKFSPLGMDDLRENLDVFYKPKINPSSADNKFNAILTKVKQNLSSYVNDRVPQIGEMNKAYAIESDTLKLLKQELSLGKDKPGVVTRKLMNIFNPKSTPYREAIENLGESRAAELRADIAGSLLSRWTPEGLGAYLTTGIATAGGTAAILNPSTIPGLLVSAAAASPRLVGEVVTKAGKLAKSGVPKKAVETFKTATKGIASKITE